MNTWKPDTCECEVEEIYNGTEIIGGGQVLHKCKAHKDLQDDEVYGVLYANPDGENKRKNEIEAMLLGQRGIDFGLHEQKFNKDDEPAGVGWKKKLKYKWAFTGNGKDRVLSFEIKGANISDENRKIIQQKCQEKFGINKVNIL